MNLVQVKNIAIVTITLVGIELPPNHIITLSEPQILDWRYASDVFYALSNDEIIIGDGESFFSDVIQAWGWLSGDGPITIKQDESMRTPVEHALKVATYKAEGSSTIVVSPSFCDKTTWYQGSVNIPDEVLATSDSLIFTSANSSWIDMIHGRVYMEDRLTVDNIPFTAGGLPKYKVHVFVDSLEKLEDTDYVVDYATGTVTFNTVTTGQVTVNYWHATNNIFSIIPSPGKSLSIEHSELQFTLDMEITSPIYFDLYVYNPADLPNKILYGRTVYKNIKDIINAANLGTGTIPALPGLNQEVCVFPFDYATLKTLRSSQGAELRISTKDNTPFNGTWGTCTFIMFSQNED